ncbi:MAG: hypothetical protein HY290_20115 [Planctomycetia bacterium]|nr:hypothetical protein [Planctomycetia bacterium]
MIFLFPLIFSVGGVLFFLTTDADWKWKALAALLVVVAIVLQFPFGESVHFLVPLFIQLAVCGWMALYWQME